MLAPPPRSFLPAASAPLHNTGAAPVINLFLPPVLRPGNTAQNRHDSMQRLPQHLPSHPTLPHIDSSVLSALSTRRGGGRHTAVSLCTWSPASRPSSSDVGALVAAMGIPRLVPQAVVRPCIDYVIFFFPFNLDKAYSHPGRSTPIFTWKDAAFEAALERHKSHNLALHLSLPDTPDPVWEPVNDAIVRHFQEHGIVLPGRPHSLVNMGKHALLGSSPKCMVKGSPTLGSSSPTVESRHQALGMRDSSGLHHTINTSVAQSHLAVLSMTASLGMSSLICFLMVKNHTRASRTCVLRGEILSLDEIRTASMQSALANFAPTDRDESSHEAPQSVHTPPMPPDRSESPNDAVAGISRATTFVNSMGVSLGRLQAMVDTIEHQSATNRCRLHSLCSFSSIGA
ncbi:hypothetical protein OE88DRAFT_1733417 [Heliocybe sulcata]|uniref:Uncharacterized protein n=1 Tax=Heliocybe sulcata TaxID=5364 RepID=A0A5C3N8D9_9AGAM|nr:hypothetical protein OE88DRAFT_1733417 [Heliocybe sulcata]